MLKKQFIFFNLILFLSNYSNPEQKHGIFTNFLIGAANAVIENSVTQPLDIVKSYAQQNQKLPKHANLSSQLKFLYRGFTPKTFDYSMAVATQTAIDCKVKPYTNEITGAIFAGVSSSALTTTPLELIAVQQQNTGLSTLEILKKLKKEGCLKKLHRGFIPTAIREGGFAGGYLAGVEKMKKIISEKTGIKNNLALAISSGLPVGLVITTVTHPADTIKTIMQGNYQSSTSTIQECKKLLKNEGLRGFFKGAQSRLGIITISITILNEFNIWIRTQI